MLGSAASYRRTLTCSIPVFRPALLIYDAPPCADHLEREVACSTCPCPLSPTATWDGPKGNDAADASRVGDVGTCSGGP